jgi:hypothetical protein
MAKIGGELEHLAVGVEALAITSPPAILLREGYREGGRVKKRTLCGRCSTG